ncbi:MAG TPA: DUF819 family protein [Longimicrobiales bacterium]|nr:DUF819 family protein [Longimicrobiales bacterium]
MAPATALLTDPMSVFAYLAAVLGAVFFVSGVPAFRRVFRVLPPVLWAYFIPTLSTTFGIIPPASPTYEWMVRYLLPIALLLLMITVDLRSILRLGPLALAMMVAGTVGTIVGGPIAFLLFGGLLPEYAWTGFAALSGSWIGGTANMVAVAESVGTPDSIMGPIIVVDTIVGYGWMAVLLFLSSQQERFDRWNRASRASLEAANRRIELVTVRRQPIDVRTAVTIIGLAFAGSVLAIRAGAALPAIGDPTIISGTTWAVLMVVTGGLLLSFTPVSRLEEHGASTLGYATLYLLLGAIGAQADLRAVLSAPIFLAAGLVWIAIHAAVLLLAARLLRAPLFFFATGSMANVGGAASAPIVASVYHPAMAPVGLLMAVGGYVLGIYGGLFCAWLLSLLA